MASAQVLPNSRKQEHLAAGKRRLEEFRKKRAADRAKKTVSTSQPSETGVVPNERPPKETENLRLANLDGAGTSDEPSRAFVEPSGAVNDNVTGDIDDSQRTEMRFLNNSRTSTFVANNLNAASVDQVQIADGLEYSSSDASQFVNHVDHSDSEDRKVKGIDFGTYSGHQLGDPYGSNFKQSIGISSHASQDFDSSSSQSNSHGLDEFHSKENTGLLKESLVTPGFFTKNSSSTSLQSVSNVPSNEVNSRASTSFNKDHVQPLMKTGESVFDIDKSNYMVSDSGGKEFNTTYSSNSSKYTETLWSSQPISFSPSTVSSPGHVPIYSTATENTSRRSRPSFLDTLNFSRASLGSLSQQNGPEGSFRFSNSNLNSEPKPDSLSIEIETAGSLLISRTSEAPNAFGNLKSDVSADSGDSFSKSKFNENSLEREHELLRPKQNEEFAALEQHIEDLTQEKFSLQRGLETSQALAESLAAENSSLTDSYNQQRIVVDQLKADMEKLQGEIKAQLVELESVKMEYANVQLECSAADERAKLLASEVITLEEKALRLRSNELKLERELEKSQAEIVSYRKKVSSLEKERQDLQSTIDALQEEKKLMQSKLRKASTSLKFFDGSNSSTNKKDMSTSTDDLEREDNVVDASNLEVQHGASISTPQTEDEQPIDSISSFNIPPDQMRMIQNINALISELGLEKEELVKALASESSMNSKLKELNKELSRKLEIQTQRLELLTSQSMAGGSIQSKAPELDPVLDDAAAYADEGDEVVERVLGWIMKLFPGGPSKRRTSKLL